jgi:hypothetical protein
VEISPEDEVFSCQINSIGAPSSVGIGNAGKDVTIIVQENEKSKLSLYNNNWSWRLVFENR